MRKVISIVIPFFNEAPNIPQIYSEVEKLRASETNYDFEILFMDNHSTDDSFAIAAGIAARDSSVRVIRLSRNFGYQSNILTGYLNARGDAAVQLDADGEDDPMLISQFLRKWEEGFQIVYGVRTHRVENFVLTFLRKVFYKVIARLSSVPLPIDSGDFRLVDRLALNALPEFTESSMYIRGVLSYMGFRQHGIPYARRPRYKGESKFRLLDYFKLAIDGITSFSSVPLTIIAQLGMFLSAASFVAAFFYIVLYFTLGVPVQGFTTLVILLLFLTGIQLFCLGIIGIYLGRVFDEVKGRPRSLIETTYPPNGSNTHA